MAITKEDKLIILEGIKTLDVKAMYASEDEDKRKWFRFGAYDALRMVTEMLKDYPETQDTTPKAKRINIVG